MNVKFARKASSEGIIHAGQGPDPQYGALSTPIYQTSTFCFENMEKAKEILSGGKHGFCYTRGGNPTTEQLEKKIATIEGSECGVATSSGMGAIGSTLLSLLKMGDHVISLDAVYGGTSTLLYNLDRFGIEVSFVDTSNIENIEKAFKPNTKMVYCETMANPTMKVTDIKKSAEIAHKHSTILVVDNTFTPPPIIFPIKLGADVVIHSLTKYLNGHGDAIGGFVGTSEELLKDIKGLGVNELCGTPISPFNAWLVLRGMKTLNLRVYHHCENAMKVANYLVKNPYVSKVNYPGLNIHPQYELCKNQMNGLFGGMISFELKEGIKGLSSVEAGKQLLNNVNICGLGVSLGDVDTLIEHPSTMTHRDMDPDERQRLGITDGLVRISVGLENVEDIISDLAQSLDKIA